MSEAKGKKAPWPVVGSLRKNENGSYIKLADNVTILVDGKPISMNKTRTVRLEDPRAKVESLRDKGFISEADADKRLEKLAEMTWLRYDLVVAPARD